MNSRWSHGRAWLATGRDEMPEIVTQWSPNLQQAEKSFHHKGHEVSRRKPLRVRFFLSCAFVSFVVHAFDFFGAGAILHATKGNPGKAVVIPRRYSSTAYALNRSHKFFELDSCTTPVA
jgi:hypothetical protein